MKKYLCEFLGTFILVLFGCGVAVVTDCNVIATSLAFGLSIVAIAYVIGNVSGCHVNPAVSFAMWIDKRISGKQCLLYVIAQVLGAVAGAGILMLILNSSSIDYGTLGANAFGDLANSEITMLGALIVEVILTFVFVLSVLGSTKDEKNSSVAPIVIGLTLVLVHLFGIALTGTSVNPARSLGPVLFLGGEALEQVWVFVLGPLVGAMLAALVYYFIALPTKEKKVKDVVKEEPKKVVESAKKEYTTKTKTTQTKKLKTKKN